MGLRNDRSGSSHRVQTLVRAHAPRCLAPFTRTFRPPQRRARSAYFWLRQVTLFSGEPAMITNKLSESLIKCNADKLEVLAAIYGLVAMLTSKHKGGYDAVLAALQARPDTLASISFWMAYTPELLAVRAPPSTSLLM